MLLLTVLVALAAIPILDLVFALPALDGLREWIGRRPFLGDLFFPDEAPKWKDKLTALIPILGLPVAFWLWHWRDRNVQDGLENSRKDINLKEFQEVQMRAAGALDEKLPAEAREQLQIAALHQLRGFLRGEYGDSFRRPAFELLLAGHAAAMERIGLKQAIDRWREQEPRPDPTVARRTIAEAVGQARRNWSAVDRERAGIIRDEWRSIFVPAFPLNGRRLDGITIPSGALLDRLQLSLSVFIGADLSRAYLEGADLRNAHFEGANLRRTRLEGANLSEAHLEGANLHRTHLEGADLIGAHLEGANLFMVHLEGANLFMVHLENAMLNGSHLEGADLREAYLEGADLRRAHLVGADLRGADWGKCRLNKASFDDATQLLDRWDWASEERRNAARDELRSLGARHVNDPPEHASQPDRPGDASSAAP